MIVFVWRCFSNSLVFYYLHENTYPGELLGFLDDSGLGVFQGFFNRGRGGGHIKGILHG